MCWGLKVRRKVDAVASCSLLLTLRALSGLLCWCLCFQPAVVFCSLLIRAVLISSQKTVPEGEEEGYSDVFENILWKLMGKVFLDESEWVYICVV